MKVHWYCGLYIWTDDKSEWDEMSECTTEFDTEEDQDDWDLEICEAICPKCGGILSQVMDHATLIGEGE